MQSTKKYSNGYWKVYVHTNKANGKRYVGITSQKPEYRWNYGNAYKSNKYFYSAICKYGWDGFTHEVMFDGLNKEQAEEIEVRMIAMFNTQNRECGYNIAAGGESNSGYVPPEEVRKKWQEARIGMKRSEETKRRQAEASARNYEKCRVALEEQKYKPVDMLQIDGEYIRQFRSIKHAMLYLNDTLGKSAPKVQHISDVCRGKRKTFAGYRWKYTQ